MMRKSSRSSQPASGRTSRASSVADAEPRGSGNSAAVKVVVVVRPLNVGEGADLDVRHPTMLVSQSDPTTLTVLDSRSGYHTPKEAYQFDRCFWCMGPDGCAPGSSIGEGGTDMKSWLALQAPSERPPNSATQNDIFDSVGLDTIVSTLSGFNTCVFAYGQTGSGKTHIMSGPPGDDDGLIPRVVSSIFAELGSKHAENMSLQRQPSTGTLDHSPMRSRLLSSGLDEHRGRLLSSRIDTQYFEVYNEKVFDLLAPEGPTNNITHRFTTGSASAPSEGNGLRIRQDPTDGAFVEGLTSIGANSADELLSAVQVGNRSRRHVAATNANARSSRSHAVLTLKITQVIEDGEGGEERGVKRVVSKLHLVDLAGSERVSLSGTEYNREVSAFALGPTQIQQQHHTQGHFRETTRINLSLTTLGRVIDVLAERSQLTKRQMAGVTAVPPYRESVLTWLLADSLGGNSRTTMIATVSPEVRHLDETLQTLRYASRAKQIVNVASVNEEEGDEKSAKRINELKRALEAVTRENATLRMGPTPQCPPTTTRPCNKCDILQQRCAEQSARIDTLVTSTTDKSRVFGTSLDPNTPQLSKPKPTSVSETQCTIMCFDTYHSAMIDATKLAPMADNYNRVSREVVRLLEANKQLQQSVAELTTRCEDAESREQSATDTLSSHRSESADGVNNLLTAWKEKEAQLQQRLQLFQLKLTRAQDTTTAAQAREAELTEKVAAAEADGCQTRAETKRQMAMLQAREAELTEKLAAAEADGCQTRTETERQMAMLQAREAELTEKLAAAEADGCQTRTENERQMAMLQAREAELTEKLALTESDLVRCEEQKTMFLTREASATVRLQAACRRLADSESSRVEAEDELRAFKSTGRGRAVEIPRAVVTEVVSPAFSSMWCDGVVDMVGDMQECMLGMRSAMLHGGGAVEVASSQSRRRSSGAGDVWGLLAARGAAPSNMGCLAGMRSTPTTPRRK